MNLTLHLVRKDLRYFRSALIAWSVSLLLLAVMPNARFSGAMNLRDFLQLFGLLMIVVVFVGLLAGIVQVDHPSDSAAQWRTRPIAPWRMLGAKLLLILSIFVVLPLVVIMASHVAGATSRLHDLQEYGFIALLLANFAVSFAATSACTKNMLFSVLLWLGVVFASGTMVELLGRVLPKLNARASAEMIGHQAVTLMVVSIVLGLLVLANQYVRRRLSASIVIFVIASVSTALIGALWNYYYFYQG